MPTIITQTRQTQYQVCIGKFLNSGITIEDKTCLAQVPLSPEIFETWLRAI